MNRANEIRKEVKKLHKELLALNRAEYPRWTDVEVRRGSRVWEVKLIDFNQYGDPDEFRAKSRTGKIHWFNANDIICKI